MNHDLPEGSAQGSRPSDDYACAIDLLGRVIALQGVLIAAERARPRADLTKIAELQAARANAVQTARHLTSADRPGLHAAIAEYRLHWTVLSSPRRRRVESAQS